MIRTCVQCLKEYAARPNRSHRLPLCSRYCWSARKRIEIRLFADRFWAFVDKRDGCWLWRGALSQSGYGYFMLAGKNTRAHRVAWMLTHGEISPGLHVLHTCDVRACVNPAHLWLGTHAENMADRDRKGRGVIPWAAREHGVLIPLPGEVL